MNLRRLLVFFVVPPLCLITWALKPEITQARPVGDNLLVVLSSGFPGIISPNSIACVVKDQLKDGAHSVTFRIKESQIKRIKEVTTQNLGKKIRISACGENSKAHILRQPINGPNYLVTGLNKHEVECLDLTPNCDGTKKAQPPRPSDHCF